MGPCSKELVVTDKEKKSLQFKKWASSEHGKKVRRKYRESERGKEVTQRAKKKYRATKGGKSKHREDAAKYRKRYPEKIYARKLVQRLVKEGKIEKPSHCLCGNSPVEAHHSDYSKPLEVEWLCNKCHLTKGNHD